ncbi:MAG: flagellar basal-body MS-ring/collar protein FliF [Bacteroidota bacterium]|nr:flagellar basal-body MS-ring/collar protein FliF [Bacteroidota bacterium]
MALATIAEQAKQFWQRLRPLQRFAIIGAVVAAIGIVVAVMLSSTTPPMHVLFSELDPKDAAAIVEKLKEQNIPYELADGGTTIRVPQSQVYELRLALAREGLPAGSTVGYEIFDRTNLGMSDFVQKLNHKRALEGELQKTIASFDEVQKVRVMIVLPEKALFEKDQKKPTASVLLHLKSGRSLSKLNIEGIQHLVASSVEGLSPADVTVVDQHGQILSQAPQDNSTLAGMTATQYEQQQKVESYLTSRVQSLLDGVLGPGNSVVRVSAELDFTQREQTRENYDPDGQVVRSEERITEARRSQDSLDYPAVNSESNATKVRTNYEISRTVERIVGGVGTIKRISASVLVNGTTKIVEQDGKKVVQYTPRSQEELQKLTQIVRNAIGYDPERNDQVTVVNLPFDTAIEEPEEPPFSLPKGNLLIGIIAVLALLAAMWALRRLIFTPPVRRRIEEIFISPSQELIQLAPAGMDIAGTQALEPPPQPAQLEEHREQSPYEELRQRVRAKLDAANAEGLTEEQLLVEEMKERIAQFIRENNADAVKLIQTMINQEH